MSQPPLPRNPADLLRLGADPALTRLLRACGADEACITGGASDYDKFLALAAVLPLCEGHPLRDAVNTALTNATGLSAPLCPHTAEAHWNAWTDKYWYGRETAPPPIPTACPLCAPSAPTPLSMADLTSLPDPTAVQAPDLPAWSRALENALPTENGIAAVTLPTDYAFTRPNPYHAGLAVGKLFGGETLNKAERDLLFTQALRVWGLSSVSRGSTLLLKGGAPDAVLSLLDYLNTSRALPSVIWIPRFPAEAGAVSGLYPSVRTGMTLPSDIPAYAAAAPIGACVTVKETP